MIEDNAAIDSNLYVRIKALENAENTITKEQMDLKLDKVEFTNFVSMLNESTISPMQKEIDKSKKDITCIESFLENLSMTIKALEMQMNSQ